MANPFLDHPIFNSPYPVKRWELDETGHPIQRVVKSWCDANFIAPIPKPKKRKAAAAIWLTEVTSHSLSVFENATSPLLRNAIRQNSVGRVEVGS